MNEVDLENARNYWEKQNARLRMAEVDGTRVEWYSAPQSVNPALPDYAWVASDGNNAIIAISDSLPEDYQKFWAYHELIETTQDTGEGKCLRTLKKELSAVPDKIKPDYAYRRTAFFRNLLSFGINNDLPKQTIKEFERSLGYLEKLIVDIK